MTLKQINHLEAIRQLKARYFRLMDTQQWDLWTNCFTIDVWASYEGAPGANPQLPTTVTLEGRSQLVGHQ